MGKEKGQESLKSLLMPESVTDLGWITRDWAPNLLSFDFDEPSTVSSLSNDESKVIN